LPQITKDNSISIYKDEFTVKNAIDQFKKLKMAFPQLPAGFYDVLMDRVKENGFTDQRLKDSINKLIDNFTYPNPSIANIISFDKRVKLNSYSELIEIQNRTGRAFEDYCKIKKNGKLFWISKAEKEQFNVPDEL
jgi:hypothetical protein